MTGAPFVFDRRLVRRRRELAGARQDSVAALVEEVIGRVVERVDEIQRPLDRVLVLGAQRGRLAQRLRAHEPSRLVVESDLAAPMLGPEGPRVVADEELLPFGPGGFDAVLSCGVLHWVNDLPGTLAQIHYTLKPDGLLLAAVPGGETLVELREALMAAELEGEGGVSPRVSPFVDIRDAGALLQRAGFALPVVDLDRIRLAYRTPLALIADLRALGETNALLQRRPGPLRRATAAQAFQGYAARFAEPEGRVAATLDIVFMAGWKPHASQQQPARRGSGKIDLADALAPATRDEDA